MSKNQITLRSAVLKTDGSFTNKAKAMLKSRGIVFVIGKIISVSLRTVWRFFMEYLPLRFLMLFSKNGEIVKKVQGSKMILNLNDLGISRELALYRVHEKNSTRQTKEIIKPGMKILEVGANIGYYAMIEARLAGPAGHLYAFEPSPFNFDLLERNLALNNFKNANLYKSAFGEKKGNIIFYVYDRSNLSSFIKREDMGMKVQEVKVEVITLDDFLKDKKVDFIRMDVEGYEREILKSAGKSLGGENPPRYFFIEIHSELLHKKNSSAREIVEYLKKYGYEVVKSFYRGGSKIVVDSTQQLLNHPLLEVGYWETFFEHKG